MEEINDGLPDQMIEEILFRTDVPEVMAFKAVSLFYRDLIGLPGFSERYNRHRRTKCNWVVSLVRTRDNNRVGFLCWLRPYDTRRMIVDLRPYIAGNPHRLMDDAQDELDLLGASGSVLIFRCLSNSHNIVYLFTINIFTNETVYLPVPAYLLFDNPSNLKTLAHPDINLAFRILYTQIVNNALPHYSELNSQTQNWEVLLDALPARPNDLNLYDARRMSLAHGPYTYFISFKNHFEQQPFFFREPTVMEIPPLFNPHVIDGWQPYMTYHYGSSGTGLAVSLVLHSHIYQPAFYSITQLALYRKNHVLNRYELVSVLPAGHTPSVPLPMLPVYSLEETDDGTVLFSMFAGSPEWGLNLLVYHYHNGVWGDSYTQLPRDAFHASPPVSTPQLTISPNPPGHFPLPIAFV